MSQLTSAYRALLTLTFDSFNLWQVNRYNLRGLAIVFAFIVLALIHLAVAAYAEARGPKSFSTCHHFAVPVAFKFPCYNM